MTELLSALLGALAGGIISAVITWIFFHRHEYYMRRLECFKRVMTHRSMPPSIEFRSALNEIFVAFVKSDEVIRCHRRMIENIPEGGGVRTEDLIAMIRAMMSDLKIRTEEVTDDFILTTLVHGDLTKHERR